MIRILNFWISYCYVLKYRLYHAVRRQSGVNTQLRKLQLIVSLTSYPRRIDSVFLTIESLLNQTLKPDKIILWLSTAEITPNDLPDKLRTLKSRGLDIRFVDENIKSYKKLIYAFEEFSDYHIVTCDDDILCPNWFLQGLYESYQIHPQAISTYRCRVMSKLSADALSPYLCWPFANNRTPSYNIFPNGGGGTWYPPNSLAPDITNRLFMKLAPTGDDIWFKAMSLLAKTESVVAKSRSIDFPYIYIQHAQAETLWQKNIYENDSQVKAVFDHFNLYDFIS